MTAKFRDHLGSALLLAFVAVLWLQRDYITVFGGIFPDIVMEIMAALIVLTVILSFTPYAAMKETEGNAKEEGEAVNWTEMAVVGVILLAWSVLLRTLGFALSGVLGFSGISWYLGGCRWEPKGIAWCIGIALAVTYLLIFVFVSLLRVPLPAGTIFG